MSKFETRAEYYDKLHDISYDVIGHPFFEADDFWSITDALDIQAFFLRNFAYAMVYHQIEACRKHPDEDHEHLKLCRAQQCLKGFLKFLGTKSFDKQLIG